MSGMPQSRILIYLAILGLIPIFYSLYRYNSEGTRMSYLESQVDVVQQQVFLLNKKQTANNLVREYYHGADPFYIAKHVQTLPLLEQERQTLEKLFLQVDVAPDPAVVRRLDELKTNVLDFSEGAVQAFPFFREIPITQTRAVEVDKNDIESVLSRLEGVDIGSNQPGPNRPQVLITDFKIDRKTSTGGSQLYNLSMKLVKREYF